MTDTAATAPQAAAPAKVDPETLVLRARPAPAIRFKRGIIVALTAAAIVVLVVTAWFALKPRSLHLASDQSDLAEPARAPADAISALPSSYGDAPRLGPPLPGDLGRPILRHQQAIAAEGTPPPTAAEQAAQTAREQAAAERKAARESAVLVQAGNRGAAGEAISESPAAAVAQSTADASRVSLDPDRDPNAQQRKADFVSAQVCRRVGLGKSMIYEMIKQGRFPRPYKISPFASRWSEREVVAWIDDVKDGFEGKRRKF